MAGAGYKLFATGDVLTAAQVNTYLMQQTVMVFASSAARTSALSGVLAEGMVSYLQDSNTLEVYDGAAWVGATGDITGLTAGTGISISSATGPVPTVTNSMATEITAKGDLIVGTGSGTFDNLAAGSNGDTIVADSSTSTGLRYQGSIAGGRNALINGGFDFSQRGTGALPGANYTLDRWFLDTYGTSVNGLTAQIKTDAAQTGFTNYARIAAGSASGTNINFSQSLETTEVRKFQGKAITVSFKYKVPVNFSATFNVYVYYSTGTDVNLANFAVSGATQLVAKSLTNTTSWTSDSVTGTLPSNATSLSVLFGTGNNTVATAQFDVAQVQLELGSVPTTFSRAGGTLQGELAACQRYYYKYASGGNSFLGLGTYYTASAVYLGVYFPVAMRIAPTLDATSGTNYYGISSNNGFDNFNSFTLFRPSTTGAFIYNSSEAAGTIGFSGMAEGVSASGYVAFTSEL